MLPKKCLEHSHLSRFKTMKYKEKLSLKITEIETHFKNFKPEVYRDSILSKILAESRRVLQNKSSTYIDFRGEIKKLDALIKK